MGISKYNQININGNIVITNLNNPEFVAVFDPNFQSYTIYKNGNYLTSKEKFSDVEPYFNEPVKKNIDRINILKKDKKIKFLFFMKFLNIILFFLILISLIDHLVNNANSNIFFISSVLYFINSAIYYILKNKVIDSYAKKFYNDEHR